MNKILKDKKVLFIGPVFYDYHSIIIKKLEAMGGEITFYPEKRDGLLFGVLNTINPDFIDAYQKRYFKLILKKIENKRFTHFFLIRGYKIPDFFLEAVKRINPDIESVLYEWDSNRNNPYFHILKYFDKAGSFDLTDCKSREDLEFIQLFYTDDVAAIAGDNTIKYDFFCFSSFTPERYEYTKRFMQFCIQNNYSCKAFCFIPKTTYFRLKYFKGMTLNESFLSHQSMPRGQYLQNLADSEIVVDFSHSTQSGLSMRIIEAYGAGKKVLTTNTSMLENPIYSADWVQVLDMDNIHKPVFAKSDYKERSSLFINNWLAKLFS